MVEKYFSSRHAKVHRIIPIIELALIFFYICALKLSDESNVTSMSVALS